MDIEAVVHSLAKHDAEYVLIGGIALAAHGSSHSTLDIDLAYRHRFDNIVRIVVALRGFRPRLRVRGEPDGVPFLFDEKTVEAGRNFTMVTDVGDLDILADVDGFRDFDDVLAASTTRPAFGITIPLLTLEGLLRAKEATMDKPHREKDRIVLPEIRAMIAEQERIASAGTDRDLESQHRLAHEDGGS